MPKIKFDKSGNKISAEELLAIEEKLALKLPLDYAKYILKHNGGVPDIDRVVIEGWSGKQTCITRFLSFGTDDQFDVATCLENLEDFIPKNYLPVAMDAGGNIFLLKTKGKKMGTVMFWDHELENNDSEKNLFVVADNFDDFINSKILSPA